MAQGLNRLNQYFTARFENEKAKQEEINSFNEELRSNPVGVAEKLVQHFEAIKAEAQKMPVFDATAGSEAHSKLRTTIVTKEMEILTQQAVNLNSQLTKLQNEAVKVYSRNVARASYNPIAHEEFKNSKELHNNTVKAMKVLDPYLVAKDTF